jgi:hypothetical protein
VEELSEILTEYELPQNDITKIIDEFNFIMKALGEKRYWTVSERERKRLLELMATKNRIGKKIGEMEELIILLKGSKEDIIDMNFDYTAVFGGSNAKQRILKPLIASVDEVIPKIRDIIIQLTENTITKIEEIEDKVPKWAGSTRLPDKDRPK